MLTGRNCLDKRTYTEMFSDIFIKHRSFKDISNKADLK